LHLMWWFLVPSIFLQMIKFHSFLWLNNTPLCIYHIFLIHLSVDGQLVLYHSLVIVNSASVISVVCWLIFLQVCAQKWYSWII
jgi:hypothetical protein